MVRWHRLQRDKPRETGAVFFGSGLANTCCPKRPTVSTAGIARLSLAAFALVVWPRLHRQSALPLTARSAIVDLVGDLLTNGCQF
jgi:hypothetical protein